MNISFGWLDFFQMSLIQGNIQGKKTNNVKKDAKLSR